MLEFQQFNQMWDETMIEYEQRAGELLEAMRQRHALDAREHRAKSVASLSSIKPSSKMLDMRRIQQTLAKQGSYQEAQRVKMQADALEATERERAVTAREQQLIKAEAAFLHRQDTEVNALRQRIQAGAEEQRVARQQDLERLLRRYANTKGELESQLKAEVIRQRKGLSALPGALGARNFRGATAAVDSARTPRATPRGSASASAPSFAVLLPGSRPSSARGTTPASKAFSRPKSAVQRPSRIPPPVGLT